MTPVCFRGGRPNVQRRGLRVPSLALLRYNKSFQRRTIASPRRGELYWPGADGLSEGSFLRMISLFRKTKTTGRVLLAVLAGILSCSSMLAQNRVATRTQISSEGSNGVLSLNAKVTDVQGQPVEDGSVSFETAKGSLGSVFVHDGWAALNLTNAPSWARSVSAVYHGTEVLAPS